MATPLPSEDSPSDSVAAPKVVATNSTREPWNVAFRGGFVAPWSGFVYLCRHPRLWWYGVIPVVLNLLISGSLYYDALLFGEDYFDYPLALRGKRRHEKKEFVRKHRYYTLGLGAAVFLAGFIPIVGAVLLAAAVVGAVQLHRRLEVTPEVS